MSSRPPSPNSDASTSNSADLDRTTGAPSPNGSKADAPRASVLAKTRPDQDDGGERDPALEIRAAVDVMFEALSHIQASMETESEEKRARTYQEFKSALYARFDHLVSERRSEQEAETAPHENGTSASNEGGEGPSSGSPGGGRPSEDKETDEEEDTLAKFWPEIADAA